VDARFAEKNEFSNSLICARFDAGEAIFIVFYQEDIPHSLFGAEQRFFWPKTGSWEFAHR
jgi:hypothetical protein